MVVIRGFEEPDFHQVVTLEVGSSGSVYGASVFIRQMQALAAPTFFVSSVDDQITGYAIGSLVSGAPEKGWILRLQVAEPYRRQGIARMLLDRLHDEFGNMAVREVFLSVSPANSRAVPLYLSFGYEEVGFRKEYFGPAEDRLILRRRI
ncbi:hypothetical protein RJ53_03110 [Methanocalculus chunghsingensis]|uniref:N-acetyltransferase domain-containing protein n=1 Tax=Methanocalculus chunghsingensis TaxID=156457 RepID=A0A8J8B4A7_9EURY|nr:GNAT family N-acetyltransferase [Methanocalculus chunghsingensis]MBR1368546.1 hypothetical protein [Methanocalculus chunghsingensis]